jgi:hypothetical protein
MKWSWKGELRFSSAETMDYWLGKLRQGGVDVMKQTDRYGKVVVREDGFESMAEQLTALNSDEPRTYEDEYPYKRRIEPPLYYHDWKGATIRTLLHAAQRYPTVGDWQLGDDNRWAISVSKLGNWRYELLVAIHELVEMALCTDRGISEEDVTHFDRRFEASHAAGVSTGEPGDDRNAPYRREHRFAENIERQIAHELGVDWGEYEQAVEALYESHHLPHKLLAQSGL